MNSEAYSYLAKLPAKIGAGVGTVITAWSAGDPSGFQSWWGWAVSPGHIRTGGGIGLALCLAYWAALLTFKPNTKDKGQTTVGINGTGERSNSVGGNQNIGHQGDNYHFASAVSERPKIDVRFENIIKISPYSGFTIMMRLEERSSYEFHNDLISTLRRNGWTVSSQGMSQSQIIDGILMRGDTEALTAPDTNTLVQAFREIGIHPTFEPMTDWPKDFLRLDIGKI